MPASLGWPFLDQFETHPDSSMLERAAAGPNEEEFAILSKAKEESGGLFGFEADATHNLVGETSGRLEKCTFTFKGEELTMDAYFWGANEEDAVHRIVAMHGNDPIKSRRRWHALGARFSNMPG
jgi:hypothetical protein